MKFFTREVYYSWYGKYEDDSQLRDAFCRYRKHLHTMEGRLPGHVLDLARLEGTDDGLIVRVLRDSTGRGLTLTLRCGDLNMGYFDLVLRYHEAEISLEDERALAGIALSTNGHRQHESDLYMHELDLTEDGRLEHRFLFHSYLTFAIRCRQLQWRREPRPDRRLPPYRNRFPGGPSVQP